MKNFIASVAILWAVLGTSIDSVQAQTKEKLCEITKKYMINGWKYLDNYNPGFKPALEKLWFSTSEKDEIFTTMCRKTDEVYFAMDQTIYTIMQNNKLNLQDKKSLIQRLVLGEDWLLLPTHLNWERKKYHMEFVERVKRAYTPDNRAKVIAYLKEEQRTIRKDLELIKSLPTSPK